MQRKNATQVDAGQPAEPTDGEREAEAREAGRAAAGRRRADGPDAADGRAPGGSPKRKSPMSAVFAKAASKTNAVGTGRSIHIPNPA